jgi:hypothetical protein
MVKGYARLAGDTSLPIDPAGKANQASKNYAVGLEMLCPGGAYYWAPEIPSGYNLAGAMLSKCEPVHMRAHSFHDDGAGIGPALPYPGGVDAKNPN